MPTRAPYVPAPRCGADGPASDPPAVRRPRRTVVIGAFAVVLLVAALIAGIVGWPRSQGFSPAAAVVGEPIATGRNPVSLAAGGGFVWTANRDDRSVTKIDPGTGRSTRIEVAGTPFAIAADDGGVWVAISASEVDRIDIASGQIRTFTLGRSVSAIAVGSGYAWVGDSEANTITRINASTQAVDAPIDAGLKVGSLLSDNGRLYVTSTKDRSVSALDERSGDIVAGPLTFSSDPGGMASIDGILYVAIGDLRIPDDKRPYSLVPIDEASMTVGASIPLNGSVFDGDGSAMWVVDPFARELRRIDPANGGPLGDPLRGLQRGASDIVYAAGDLWLIYSFQNEVVRVHDNH